METLERGWNTGDGSLFAAPFASDATFVDIRGTLHRTRDVIARGHEGIFSTIYKGSRVRYSVLEARELAPGHVLALTEGTLVAPIGPLAGEHRATQTLVARRAAGEGREGRNEAWEIVRFHNTLVASPPPGPGAAVPSGGPSS